MTLRLAVRLQHSHRIGRAALGVEVGAVDDVAAIGGQGDPSIVSVGAERGLANWPAMRATLTTSRRCGGADHRRHLQQQVEAAADLVGAELGEGLGAIAALEQEALAGGDLGELRGERPLSVDVASGAAAEPGNRPSPAPKSG